MIYFSATPQSNYASNHQLSLLSLIGLRQIRSPKVNIQLNFGLQTAPSQPSSLLTFTIRDMDTLAAPGTADFSITNLTRWRVNTSQFTNFDEFLDQALSRRLKKKYLETQAVFYGYGAHITYIEGDWSEQVDAVYALYTNVAKKHGTQLYDHDFFKMIAPKDAYKLLCFWHNNRLFAALVIVEEPTAIHSLACCLDYHHSRPTRAYSQLHYELIRLAIESKRYRTVDIGITADKAKSMMGFRPIPTCMDVSSHNPVIKKLLQALSYCYGATINDNAKLEFNFQMFRKSALLANKKPIN